MDPSLPDSPGAHEDAHETSLAASSASAAAELDRAIAIADQMRRSNQVLKEALESRKADVVSTQQQLQAANVKADQAVAAKLAMERECETLYQQWNDHLKKQADEFSELQSRMVPSRELEMLRSQLVEELEYPHRQRVAALVQDTAKFRDLYFATHRDLELLRGRVEQATEAHEAQVRGLMQDATRKYTALEQRNRKLQQLVQTPPDHATRIAQLEQENDDLHVRRKELEAEAAQLRKEKEAAVVERDAGALRHQQAETRMQGDAVIKERAYRTLQQQLTDLKETVEAAERARAHAKAQLVALEQKQSGVKQHVQQRDREIQHLKTTHTDRIDELRRVEEQKRHRLKLALDNVHKQLAEAIVHRDTAASELAVSIRDAAVAVKKAQEEGATRTRNVELKKAALALRVSELEKQVMERDTTHASQRGSSQQQHEVLISQVNGLREERAHLEEQARATTERTTQLQADFAMRTEEYEQLAEEYEQLQAKHRQCVQKKHVPTTADRGTLLADVDVLRQENGDLASDLERERNALRHVREQLAKAKKDKSKYKRMAQLLRESAHKAAAATSASSESVNSRTDPASLSRRLREAERLTGSLRQLLARSHASSATSAAVHLGMPTS